jgi:hypothetical protein
VLGGRIGGVFSCVALIHVSDLDHLACLGLYALGKFGELSPILFIGGCHAQREKIPQSID